MPEQQRPSATRLFFSLTLLCLFVSPAVAQQEIRPHEKTTYPWGCYEIVQSQVARRHTFRLDKCTGTVDQMTEDANGGSGWERMPSTVPTIEPDGARFALFVSGWTAKDMFLLDTHAGLTWRLTLISDHPTLPDDAPMWVPVDYDPIYPDE